MKFSTTFTLATLALLSIGTTHARIGNGQQLGGRGEKCNPNYGGQCFHLGKDFKCQNTRLGGNKPDYRCINTKPTPTPGPPAHAKPVTCDPQNPVNPDFDCTQKVGPGSKCQSQISGDKWVYQCTKLADHHHRSLETANLVLSASESSPITFGVYIAIKKKDSRCSPNCVVGFLDDSWPPTSKHELNGGECVQVGESNPDDGYYVNYYIDTPNLGMETGYANCANIGNENNAKCGLPNLPGLRACVIYIHI